MANATKAIEYLSSSLLDDPQHTIWGTSELQDHIHVAARTFITTLARVNGTLFDSGRQFWLEYGSGVDQAYTLSISVSGSTFGTLAGVNVATNDVGTVWSVDLINGRVTFNTAYAPDSGANVVATYSAVNLYRIAQMALLRYQQSTAITGEKKTIRLGPLSKSVTGPSEMVLSFKQRIDTFARFAAAWETANAVRNFQRL